MSTPEATSMPTLQDGLGKILAIADHQKPVFAGLADKAYVDPDGFLDRSYVFGKELFANVSYDKLKQLVLDLGGNPVFRENLKGNNLWLYLSGRLDQLEIVKEKLGI